MPDKPAVRLSERHFYDGARSEIERRAGARCAMPQAKPMDVADCANAPSSHEDVPENPPGLPQCHYRRYLDGVKYRCEAADGDIVCGDDCRACSIPAAIAHKDACLYLIPLRHEGKARYACSWFFKSARKPVVDDWRELCFCAYWFPRGAMEAHVLRRAAPTRSHYLEVLRSGGRT